ncbi:FAD:protein FMN transferase [Massilia cavernae]|uniref:FAD:protein FMN transferase n=2 Tax=Massilia cavernae TaxID=2320864 RepID=A0A418Y5L5_9BURK|nr:FAD:protein FMN transferase [Massilia cavernae]
MASECEIRLAAGDAGVLAGEAIAEVRRIESKFSRYRPDSVIACINQAAGRDWTGVDDETGALLDYAAALHATSGGLFDITSGVLRRAWNFTTRHVPAAAELAPLLALVGWDKVHRRTGAVRLGLEGMELDFGGFGKEYAADRAAALLAARGVRHGYVNLGGDMRVIGPRPDGQPWNIAIQDPRIDAAVIASIPVTAGALATSGDYERYFETGGRRYCHILHPASGCPVTFWRSVSVLAPLATVAGSHATIAMLKQHGGLRFLDDSGLAYLAVDREGRIHHRHIAAMRGQ